MKITSLPRTCRCLLAGHWIATLLLTLAPLPVAAADGDLDPSFNPNANDIVYSTAVQPDGKLLIGGNFTNVAGGVRSRIARLNASGTLDTGFNPTANNTVYSTAVQADGKTVIGGAFNNVVGTAREAIARLNADGTLAPDFNLSIPGFLFCTAMQMDGKIVFGGAFNSVGGIGRKNIARLNANGTLDTGFISDVLDPNSTRRVYCTAVQTDGKIIFGGIFTNVAGTTRSNIVRLNADGTLDTGFNPSASHIVSSIAIQADGKILIGGGFINVAGTPRNRIARLNANGTLDSGFNPDANSNVGSSAIQADGKILIGGGFSSVAGSTRNRIARLNTDGTLDTSFNADADDFVECMAVQADGAIVIGGRFAKVAGVTRNRIARLLNGPATDALSVPSAARVVWLRGGTAPETIQATFELSIDGINWTLLGAGTRISGGWELTGLNLPSNGTIRARARTLGGAYNGSSGLVEQRIVFPPGPDITLEQPAGTGLVSGSTVDFGPVAVGSSSAVKTFTIRSTGSVALTGLAITKDGTNPGDFTVSALGLTTLSPGSSTTFGVSFSPIAPGPRSAAIHIASNDSDENPFDIVLAGETPVPAPEIAVEQPSGSDLSDGSASVDFGNNLLGANSQRTFTIRNTGNADLTGLGMTITGLNASDFTVIAAPTAPVSGSDGSTAFTVRFVPGAAGERSALLHIANNDSNESPFDINLTGAGHSANATTWAEGWQVATPGIYVPTDTTYDGFLADRGGWMVYDSAPDCNGGPHPNTAEVLSIGINKILKLTAVPNTCVSDITVDLFAPPNIPITPDTGISFTETGSLQNPTWNGFFPTLFPPPGDHTHLFLLDQNKNALVYIFQRTPNYTAHTTTLQVEFPDGHIGPVGYREVFVDAYNATGGTYIRNLFQDFSQVPGFNATGAVIDYISLSISGVGVASFDDLKIGSGIVSAAAIAVEQPAGSSLVFGSAVDFGISFVGGQGERTFTIKNTGNADLTGLNITITGPNANDFIVTTVPASVVPGFGGSTSFTVRFVAGTVGEKSATIHITSNDRSKSPFDIALQATVATPLQFAQQAYLKASNTGANDWFGMDVAVAGDTVVVGARFEDSNATGVNGNQADNSAPDSGAAYVFVRSGTNWIQQAYLKASNAGAGDLFGESVSVSGDTVVVGARSEASNATGVNGNQSDNSAFNAGAAYVFVRNGTNWSQQAYLKASNTGDDDNFGRGVSVAGDTVVVGAYLESSSATGVNGNQGDDSASGAGAAYVFVRNGSTWTQQAYLKASNTEAGDMFGYPVAVAGDTIVVGAVLEASRATGVNGNQGDNSAAEAGATYVFARNGTTWSQQAYLKASNTGAADRFGSSVGVSGDTVVVGAPWEDSNATGANSSQSDNSASKSGAAYVFVRNGSTWSQQAYLKASNSEADDNFGESVAVSGDTIVVGAFEESSNAAGVNGNQTNNGAFLSGAAYVFARNGINWAQHAYLKASNPELADFFGFSVAVSGGTVVIGARAEDSNAVGVNGNQSNNSADASGAAYIFGLGIGSKIAFAPEVGGYVLRFNGVPGLTYRVQRAASVTGPWATINTQVAPASGLIEYHETNPLPGQAFYRTVQP